MHPKPEWEGSHVQQTLDQMARDSHRLRLRVSLVCFSTGAIVFVVMQGLGLTQAYVSSWNAETPPAALWSILSNLGPPIMLLALRPSDKDYTRVAAFLLSLLWCVTPM